MTKSNDSKKYISASEFSNLNSEEKIMKFIYNADGTLTGKSDLLVFEDKKKGLQLDYL